MSVAISTAAINPVLDKYTSLRGLCRHLSPSFEPVSLKYAAKHQVRAECYLCVKAFIYSLKSDRFEAKRL